MEETHGALSPFDPAARFALAADGDAGARAALSKALTREGYVVITAIDGQEAVEIASIFPFSVIVLCRDLPDMDGDEAFERIRALGGDLARIPILFHSRLAGTAPESSLSAAVAKPAASTSSTLP